MQNIIFIRVNEVIAIHKTQIRDSGGKPGIHDLGLLESAVLMPQLTFNGYIVYENIYQMAAALMYHLIKNHAFNDANKRTAVISTAVFLGLNNIQLNFSNTEIYNLTIEVAKSPAGDSEKIKSMLAKVLESNCAQIIYYTPRKRSLIL